MASVLKVMPELEGEEMNFVQGLIEGMEDDLAMQFAAAYRN